MFPLRDDQPTYSPPIVTTLIIIACTFVFLFELSLDDYSRDYFIRVYGLVPAHFRPSTLVTSMFLHGGWLHIIGNMLFLWAFGKSLEDALGHTKFLGFYFITGIIAGIVHVLFNFDSRIPTVGASGAIAGVMGAYLIKFPRAEIRTVIFIIFFFTTLDIPAAWILVYWFVTQLFSGYGAIAQTTHVTDSGVAVFAHIGGFVSGMILVNMMGTRQRYFPRRRDMYW
jgi:membrane associated rhomboid family serine protease